jgi:integrase
MRDGCINTTRSLTHFIYRQPVSPRALGPAPSRARPQLTDDLPRRSLGLRDVTVDLDSALASVDLQRTTDGYEPVDKKVKSESGNRTFALDSFTVTAWHAHLARRARWQLVNGYRWPDTGFFFVRPDGHKWHPDIVTKRFNKLVRDAGLPPIRLHDLRHCAATFLKAAGGDLKDIQELLGHSTSQITSDIYTSVLVELEVERDKAEKAAALVPRQRRRAACHRTTAYWQETRR